MNSTKFFAAAVFGLAAHASISYAQDYSVPHQFSPNTPAKAEEVNENFDYLADQFGNSSANNPRVSVTLNCDEDPWAMNKAYNEYSAYRDVRMLITGACYGDIALQRDANGELLDTYLDLQIAGRSIHVYSATAEPAAIIPNPITNRAALFGTFGGGLYVNNVSMTMGDNDGYAFLWSRNAHGDLNNVTINGKEVGHGTAVVLQYSSQVYLGNVTINNTNFAAVVNHGSSMLINGQLNVDNVNEGIHVTASTVFQQAPVTVASNYGSIVLNNNAAWTGWGQTATITRGNLYANGGSTMVVANLNTAQHIDLHNAQLNIDNAEVNSLFINLGSTLTASNLNALGDVGAQRSHIEVHQSATIPRADFGNHSSFSVANLNVTDRLNANSFSQITVHESAVVNHAEAAQQSALRLHGATVGNLTVVEGSRGHLGGASSASEIHVWNRSALTVDNDTRFPLDTLQCDGLSTVDLWWDSESPNLLVDAPNTGCMSTWNLNDLGMMIRSFHGWE